MRWQFGNPSSYHIMGRLAATAVEQAREQVAGLLGCGPGEIVFTSGGTEADNAAICSALSADSERQGVVTSSVEHPAVIQTLNRFCPGNLAHRVGVDEYGHLDVSALDALLRRRSDIALLSVMAANNETGVLFQVEELAELAHEHGVLFHTDAVQAVGKIPFAVASTKIGLLSISSHKLHGPKGLGALYVSRRTRFHSMLVGGSQENRRRAGTENVAGIVGFGVAAEMARAALAQEQTDVANMRHQFEEAIFNAIPCVQINGDRNGRLPNTTNLRFSGVDGDRLLVELDAAGLCCSAGSACASGNSKPSHVLMAMGLSAEDAKRSLRFSFSRYNTPEEVQAAAEIVSHSINMLRRSARTAC